MLHRLASRIHQHFCIDWSQLKRTKWTKLTDRSLLVLQGPDTHKLLQGLVTNDLRELGEKKKDGDTYQKIALFTLFLQPKGKVLTDAFVFKPRIYKNGKAKYDEEQLWLDIDKNAKPALKQHLKRHLWRKNATLIDIQEQSQGGHIPTLYSGYNEQNQSTDPMLGASVQLQQMESGEEDSYANLIYFDPRGTKFGLRIVSSQEHLDVTGHFQTITEQQYHKVMERLGMPPRNLYENRLPFQFNFDFLHAISLKKGCYIGQEIVSRGFLTGIIRKRVFTFVLEKNEEKIQENSVIKLQNGEQIGKILTYSEGRGLALVNYIPLVDKNWPIPFIFPYKGQLQSPFGDKMKQYIQDMKGKQKVLQELQL